MVMKGQFLRQDSFDRYHAAVFDGFSLEGCMKKEERVQRMKRRLIGLEGPLDEAQWHEVDRALSGTAAYTFSMTSLLLQLSLIWDAYSHQRVTVSFGTMALFMLQITILVENMRREGFEFCLGRPEVIIKEIDGIKCEPFEQTTDRKSVV